jgi:hypothetical protein
VRIKSLDELKPKKPKKPRVRREEPEHIKLVRWFKDEYPGVVIHHSPNGEARDSESFKAMLRGKRLKEMGVYPGFWDLFIPGWFTFIEVKPAKPIRAYLSQDQKLFRDTVEPFGYKFLIAYGWLDGKEKTQKLVQDGVPCLK